MSDESNQQYGLVQQGNLARLVPLGLDPSEETDRRLFFANIDEILKREHPEDDDRVHAAP
jgi:hypothetical protein